MFNVKGKEIKAHKGILATGSDAFETMFTIEIIENKNNQVNIIDIEYDVFEQLLRYIYCGKVNGIQRIAAEKYGIKSLIVECENELIKKISIENCLHYLNLSDSIGTKLLEKNAIEFITDNFEQLKDSLNDLPKNLVFKILQNLISRPKLNSKPELDVAQFYLEKNYRVLGVWVDSSNGRIPSNAVVGGSDVDEEPLYVARAIQQGNVIPGKISRSLGGCCVGHEGKEHYHQECQVLTNPNGANLTWVEARDGNVPSGALLAGKNKDGEALYVGRVWHSNSLIIGGVYPSRKLLYVPFGCQELSFNEYEVLVCKDVQ